MQQRISKRNIRPGMVIDAGHLYVYGPFGSHNECHAFGVIRTELKVGRNVRGERTEQSLTVWDKHGFRITYYLHFEDSVTVLPAGTRSTRPEPVSL